MSYSPLQLERLAKNYHTLAPRLDEVVELFIANLNEELDQTDDWTPPTSTDHERLVELISKIGQSFDDSDQLFDHNDHLETTLHDHRYLAVRESLLSAIAWVSDYTWTAQLRTDWSLAFDLVPNMLLIGSTGKQAASAA